MNEIIDLSADPDDLDSLMALLEKKKTQEITRSAIDYPLVKKENDFSYFRSTQALASMKQFVHETDNDPVLKSIDDELALLLGNLSFNKVDEKVHDIDYKAKSIYRQKMRRVPVIGETESLDECVSDWSDIEEIEEVMLLKKTLPITVAGENRIRQVRRIHGNQEVIKKFLMQVRGEHIQTLNHGVWLNDLVINFYFKLLYQRCVQNQQNMYLRPHQKMKCFFHKTFFYTKMMQDNQYDYERVRRWSKQQKLIIIEQDIMFVPVHVHGNHWCLAVVDFIRKTFSYYDSLRGRNDACLRNLRRYIKDEAKEYCNIDDYDLSGFIDIHVKDSPVQMNGCDCGVFTVKTADYLSEGLPLNFSQSDMRYFRDRMVLEIASGTVL